ncbi:hypothetical protein [Salisediminibacterium halotolerans]|nr:hypothetical protein [Salisediminibacterium halotolerans]
MDAWLLFFMNKLASKKRMTQHPGFFPRESETDETLQGISPKPPALARRK